MHCVNAMGDTRWCASKGDALQISPPIRQTSPGGRHTSTELSLCCTNLKMRTVRCQTNLSCTFLSCTNLSVQIWVVQIWVVQIWVVQILVAQIWVAKICYAQMCRWAACTGRQICGLHILGAPAVLRLRPSKGILQPLLLPFQMHQYLFLFNFKMCKQAVEIWTVRKQMKIVWPQTFWTRSLPSNHIF